jgi:hypothetical protein
MTYRRGAKGTEVKRIQTDLQARGLYLGQGSLQPLLRRVDERHPGLLDEVFAPGAAELRAMLVAPHAEQLAWARSIQDLHRFVVVEPWRGFFKTLGRREEFQAIQREAAQNMYGGALAACRSYGVRSERASRCSLTFA